MNNRAWYVVRGALLLTLAGTASAQTLERRVSAAPDGSVRFSFAARPGVYGNGRNMIDLGTVSAKDAASYLLAFAMRDESRAAEKAIFPAVLADSVTIWPDLLKIAKSDQVSRKVRRSAVFWLGQAVGDAATKGLTDLVDDGNADRDVRESAVFALSQRPHEEGVPALIRIVRENKDPELRRKAIFWLGQSDDPRALSLFEELLTRP